MSRPPQIQDPPENLLPAEAAELLRVSTRHLARAAKDGQIQAVKTPGGQRRYPSAQFAYIYAYLRGETDGES